MSENEVVSYSLITRIETFHWQEECDDFGNKYRVYPVHVRIDSGKEWTIAKRYSEFRELYFELCSSDKEISNFEFPRKTYFFHAESDCAHRKISFESLLNMVLKKPALIPELNYFLSVSEHSRQPTNSRLEGVELVDIKIGDSNTIANKGVVARVQYVGKLASTKAVFDKSPQNQPFNFRIGHDSSVIRGWHIGIIGMRVGGTRQVTVPPEKAYGRRGVPPEIPPNETLIFKVKLIDVV